MIAIDEKVKRNVTIDIMKGFAIMLVVLGHSGCPLTKYIYLFHMAVFLMASGYCFRPQNVENLNTYKQYVLKKITGLWVPYFAFNSICWIFYNKFIDWNFLTDNLAFSSPVSKLAVLEIVNKIIQAFHFEASATQQFCGADWFIIILFYINVGFGFLCLFSNQVEMIGAKIQRKISTDKNTSRKENNLGVIQHVIFVGSAVIALYAGSWLQKKEIVLDGYLSPTISCYALYVLGFYLKKCSATEKFIEKYRFLFVLFGGGIIYILQKMGSIALNSNHYTNINFLLICSLVGWYWLMALAKCLEANKEKGYWQKIVDFMRRMVIYVGRRSLYILFLHFLSFKVITLLLIGIYKEPRYQLASFPILNKGGFWWIAYFGAGVAFPLLIEWCWRKIKEFWLHWYSED